MLPSNLFHKNCKDTNTTQKKLFAAANETTCNKLTVNRFRKKCVKNSAAYELFAAIRASVITVRLNETLPARLG